MDKLISYLILNKPQPFNKGENSPELQITVWGND